jgi:hypothetical protein
MELKDELITKINSAQGKNADAAKVSYIVLEKNVGNKTIENFAKILKGKKGYLEKD